MRESRRRAVAGAGLRGVVGGEVAVVVEGQDAVAVRTVELAVERGVGRARVGPVEAPGEAGEVDGAAGHQVAVVVALDRPGVGIREVGGEAADEGALDRARDHRVGRGIDRQRGGALAGVAAEAVARGLGEGDGEVALVVALGDAGARVRVAVAVVVRGVAADLERVGVGVLVGVVAVGRVADRPRGGGAGRGRAGGVAQPSSSRSSYQVPASAELSGSVDPSQSLSAPSHTSVPPG